MFSREYLLFLLVLTCAWNMDLDLKKVCAALLHYDLGIPDKSPDWHQWPLSAELLNEAAIHVQLLLCLKDACEAWAPWAQAIAIGWLDDPGH